MFSASTSGGLFSNNNSGGGLFGAPTTVAQPASSGGLFGQQPNTAFGKPATSNAFGASSGEFLYLYNCFNCLSGLLKAMFKVFPGLNTHSSFLWCEACSVLLFSRFET